MKTKLFSQLLLLLLIIGSTLLFSCTNFESKDVTWHVDSMESPASKNSSEPNMHVGINGTVYLSWVEIHDNNRNVIFYSTIKNNNWSSPIMVCEDDNMFVNWADFPSMSSFGDNSIASHFLVKKEGDTYAYDVNISISNDKGLSWSKPITPHRDSTPTEHGFVSMVPYKDQFLAVWLDGRNYSLMNENDTMPTNEMTLRSALINKKGQLSEELVIDDRVCSCCQTDAALVSTGPILVYRDRSKKEIRDISVVRLIEGRWTEPQPVFKDNWEIGGCPVNGPAIEVNGNVVAVAWFTAANDTPKVKVAFSVNNGQTFNSAIVISDSNPTGRVDLIVLNDKSALVSWLESNEEETMIKVCRIGREGALDKSIVVARSSKSRSSGFPKMVMKNDTVYFAWTDIGETLNVKTAYLKLMQK